MNYKDFRQLQNNPAALLEAAEREDPLPRKVKTPMPLSEGEETVARDIKALGLPEPVREYKFHPTRDWRFDFAWPERKIALEVDGVMWDVQGGHQAPDDLAIQNQKQNEAIRLGWDVYRFTTAQVRAGEHLGVLEEVLR